MVKLIARQIETLIFKYSTTEEILYDFFTWNTPEATIEEAIASFSKERFQLYCDLINEKETTQ